MTVDFVGEAVRNLDGFFVFVFWRVVFFIIFLGVTVWWVLIFFRTRDTVVSWQSTGFSRVVERCDSLGG